MGGFLWANILRGKALKIGKIVILSNAAVATFWMAVPAEASHSPDKSRSGQDREYSYQKTVGQSGDDGKSASSVRSSTVAALSKPSRDSAHSGGIEIPEPSNLFMLGLGLLGLVAGRYAAKRRRKKNRME